jgi:hypothetical protein
MRIIKHTTVLIICISLLSACKKKSSSDPATNSTPAPTINGSMTAVLNGNNWTSIKNSAEFLIDTTQGISGIAINGETSADLFVFGIDFPNTNTNISVNTHDFGLAKDDAVFLYTKKTSNGGTLIEHSPDEATINITSVDNSNKKISGTFTLKAHKIGSSAAADSINIKNGVFTNISFTTRYQ